MGLDAEDFDGEAVGLVVVLFGGLAEDGDFEGVVALLD